eukprot:TRINITY_DN8909_c0_g1_i6.p1 TRINITY_DN8909_c0_g1~~TRINITY_DN8909_c0_g1_i6.p1  ORF type:complete len:204 (+),score=33.18 TRINITY_DN8909_c0_g1_i6:35-646(+)
MFSALPSCCSSSLEEEVQVIGEDDRANPVPASEQENLGWKMQLGRAALANAATCGKNIAALADAATCGSSPCSACPCRAEVIDSTSAARSKPCKPFKEVISKVQGKWRSMPDGTAVGDIRGEEIHWDEFHYGGARPCSLLAVGNTLHIKFEGKAYSANVSLGKVPLIKWSDGELWFKDPQPEGAFGNCCALDLEPIPPELVSS